MPAKITVTLNNCNSAKNYHMINRLLSNNIQQSLTILHLRSCNQWDWVYIWTEWTVFRPTEAIGSLMFCYMYRVVSPIPTIQVIGTLQSKSNSSTSYICKYVVTRMALMSLIILVAIRPKHYHWSRWYISLSYIYSLQKWNYCLQFILKLVKV